MAAETIRRGMKEVGEGKELAKGRQREAGGGRKALTQSQRGLHEALDRLVDASPRGDPESPLRWTCKSTTKLAVELRKQGYSISEDTVGKLLKAKGYSLQSNRKRDEGRQHPDRDAQFQYISRMVAEFQRRGAPVISVDTKKKELVGNYLNRGRQWRPKGAPEEVRAYDFIDEELGKAIPYGVFDPTYNEGWVSVGVDHDTARFAVNSIRRWWEQMGEWRYPDARQILIMADGGGSNSSRSRLWKKCLQQWADEERLTVVVCHFPPGTSKWNKIEHRMFCHITQNWRGRPLVSHQVLIQLIAATCTNTGLRIQSELDSSPYPKGLVVSDQEMASLHLHPSDFHGEWNYSIIPSF
jgi:transposase